jgi:hypothetical protein
MVSKIRKEIEPLIDYNKTIAENFNAIRQKYPNENYMRLYKIVYRLMKRKNKQNENNQQNQENKQEVKQEQAKEEKKQEIKEEKQEEKQEAQKEKQEARASNQATKLIVNLNEKELPISENLVKEEGENESEEEEENKKAVEVSSVLTVIPKLKNYFFKLKGITPLSEEEIKLEQEAWQEVGNDWMPSVETDSRYASLVNVALINLNQILSRPEIFEKVKRKQPNPAEPKPVEEQQPKTAEQKQQEEKKKSEEEQFYSSGKLWTIG